MAGRERDKEQKGHKGRLRIGWGIAFFFAFLQVILTLSPFVFMVLNSFRKQFDMLSQGVFHLPEPWIFTNYTEVIRNGFFGYFLRSVIVVAVSLLLMLAIASMAAYPLSRMQFRLRPLIYAGIVAMMSVPMHVTLIPIFKMTTDVGLYDTLGALIGPYVTFALPMAVFILTAFMMTIPRELEESAQIDGCNRYQNFSKIILPLSKSGLSTLAIYNGVSMWNEFAFANTLIQSPGNKTLPLALGQFKGEHSLDIPLILAVLTLSALPMIILFIIFQDKLVKGMMAGAVKG
ncbi:carbohydrate ABC transporter permease [Lachnoclostridium sp. Marseille-P6806]|uniref:carbohydrate ABC transporter permease n=1 Tax=Lachnoclostridium sp. Marseille-P6806 TaxID=2364793 RepID=UPI00103129EB|nr:carbohydrate ABC transporter permease [Lachnoclostridium sp. Marseille-P6806]